ncbi:MAG: AMP-binding protein [Syntrophaceae bacterium]|nr:AMP-binding protein [Syntrophaceae bacterium]
MDRTLQRELYRRLDQSPERHALAYINNRGEFSWRTLEEVCRQAAGYSPRLKELGLGQGDVCILALPSNAFCATLLITTLLLGAVPLLVAPPILQLKGRYSNLTQVLRHMIRKTKPKIVIVPKAMMPMREELEGHQKRTHLLFEEEGLSPDLSAGIPQVTPAESDIAAMQLTSGTTGFPRVCVWQQRNVTAALDGIALAMDLNQEDICLNWTPLYHDMGLVNNFLLCLTKGIPLAMLNPIDFVNKPALWLRGLSDTASTMTWSPNFGFAITAEIVRDDQMEGVRLDRVRAFWNAAERIHLETIQAFYKRFAPFGLHRDSLKTNYGCAENIGGATFSDPHGPIVVEQVDDVVLQQKGMAQPIMRTDEGQRAVQVVGVGRPYPGIEIKILSRKGRPLPDGHVGELALKTPSRMSGYLGQTLETRRALFGDLLRTGDLGYMRGPELFWVGRLRERITTLGRKLDPSDFERVLLRIPNLRHGCFAVFGVDDAQLGTQRVVVVSEVRDSSTRPYRDIVNDIQSQISLQLGVKAYDIILLPKDTLTKTSSGKRRHRYFRQRYLSGELQSLRLSDQEKEENPPIQVQRSSEGL